MGITVNTRNVMKKTYEAPTTTAVAAHCFPMMASGNKGGGLTGNVDSVDQVIGNGGDDNEGLYGDAKDNPYDLWDD